MITGIVAEYNPFHYGHRYQIEQIKNTEDDLIIAVMSGNFVQRCEPAFFEKHSRAEAAIKGGVDLVIELPVRFSIASAEKFAFGAVFLLDKCGCDRISFGSECGDIKALTECAEKLAEADENGTIARSVSGNESFAKTRQRISGSDLLARPNNTLAVEYIKAIKKIHSKMIPSTIKRTFDYHTSASILRKNIAEGNYNGLPETTKKILLREQNSGNFPTSSKNIEKILLAFLRNSSKEDFIKIYGINEKSGFRNRILNSVAATSVEEAYDMIKSKNYPRSTARRCLLSAYLKISNSNIMPDYIHPLAFNERGRNLIKQIGKTSKIVYNLSDLKDDIGKTFADEERRATDLFGLSTPSIQKGFSEFTKKTVPLIK